MAIEIVLTAEDRASPVIKNFAAEAESALAAISQAANAVAASLSQIGTSLEAPISSVSFLTENLARSPAAGTSGALGDMAEGAQGAAESLAALNSINQEASDISRGAELAFQREATAIKTLAANVTELGAQTKAGPADLKAAFANVELIRSALTEEQLKNAIKKVQSNLAGVVSMARALGPAWFSFNEQATAQFLSELIESQRKIIQLPVTGRGADILAVFNMARLTSSAAPSLFQQGGFVTGPFGVAEEGEFVVRPVPARQNAPLLEAINQGFPSTLSLRTKGILEERPVGNFNFFINVRGSAESVNWREIARKEIIPEIKRVLSRQ